jgi:hypothetical protein
VAGALALFCALFYDFVGSARSWEATPDLEDFELPLAGETDADLAALLYAGMSMLIATGAGEHR